MPRERADTVLAEKMALRRLLLRQMKEAGDVPVIIEADGDLGVLYASCYRSVEQGIVFDADEGRAAHLAMQRPAWAVYQGDCVRALIGGVGGHLAANVLDVDMVGGPWPAIEAFFGSERPLPDQVYVVARDRLRRSARQGKAWRDDRLRGAVEEFGNNLHPVYLEVCRWLLERIAEGAGFEVSRFTGFYGGLAETNTHFLALFARVPVGAGGFR